MITRLEQLTIDDNCPVLMKIDNSYVPKPISYLSDNFNMITTSIEDAEYKYYNKINKLVSFPLVHKYRTTADNSIFKHFYFK